MPSITLSPAQMRELAALVAERLVAQEKPEASPRKGKAADQVVATPATKPNGFVENVLHASVDCAHGVKNCAAGPFRANGTGSQAHTSCPEGKRVLEALTLGLTTREKILAVTAEGKEAKFPQAKIDAARKARKAAREAATV